VNDRDKVVIISFKTMAIQANALKLKDDWISFETNGWPSTCAWTQKWLKDFSFSFKTNGRGDSSDSNYLKWQEPSNSNFQIRQWLQWLQQLRQLQFPYMAVTLATPATPISLYGGDSSNSRSRAATPDLIAKMAATLRGVFWKRKCKYTIRVSIDKHL